MADAHGSVLLLAAAAVTVIPAFYVAERYASKEYLSETKLFLTRFATLLGALSIREGV
jgi:hypothetical protein